MKILDVILLLILLTLLGLGLYVLWINLPKEPVAYEEFRLEGKIDNVVFSNGAQFYPNMRYTDRKINYGISELCDEIKQNEIERAFAILAQETVLSFIPSEDGQIEVLCSNVSPNPEEEGHFVAGEGGPSEIINTSKYAVILSGKVSLYRDSECKKPNIAIHEILHALGFDHNDNTLSIMYPVTECNQEIDQYIIEDINRLYKVDSSPDLAIEKLSVIKKGRYLDFEITIGNLGLKDSQDSSLTLYTNNVKVKDFELSSIEIGTRKILTVENLRVPRKADVLVFEIQTFEQELDKTNNKIEAVERVK